MIEDRDSSRFIPKLTDDEKWHILGGVAAEVTRRLLADLSLKNNLFEGTQDDPENWFFRRTTILHTLQLISEGKLTAGDGKEETLIAGTWGLANAWGSLHSHDFTAKDYKRILGREREDLPEEMRYALDTPVVLGIKPLPSQPQTYQIRPRGAYFVANPPVTKRNLPRKTLKALERVGIPL